MLAHAYTQGKFAALRRFKLAAKDSESAREEPDDVATTVAKGLGGAIAPIAANTAAAEALHHMPSYHSPDVDFSEKANFDKLKQQMGEPTVVLKNPPLGGAAMGYGADGKPTAYLPKNTSDAVAGHEIGHAKNWRKVQELLGEDAHDALWAGRGLTTSAGALTTIPASIAAATDPDASWTPAALQAGLYAPTLIDEGLASAHSVKNLVKQHGWSKGLRRGSPLLPAFATYGAIGLTPAAITAGRRAWRRFHPGVDDSDANDSSDAAG